MTHDDEESIPDTWRRLARNNREHVEKHPDCIDRDERLRRAAQYEQLADEQERLTQ